MRTTVGLRFLCEDLKWVSRESPGLKYLDFPYSASKSVLMKYGLITSPHLNIARIFKYEGNIQMLDCIEDKKIFKYDWTFEY